MRAKVRDTELYFDVDGMGLVPRGDRMVERPVLFLVHGGPGGEHSRFKTHSGALREVAQLVYVDHRGSGRSAIGDPATYTLDNNVDDLEALREHLGLDRISMLGSSYGGMVAQGYALRYPHRLANLILVCTAPSYRFLADARTFVQSRGTPHQVRVCQRLWDGAFDSVDQLREFFFVMGPLYSRRFRPEEFEEGWQRGVHSVVPLNRGFGDFLRRFDFTDRLHEIPCPTLVLAGAHDWICAPQHARLIADRIPRAHLKVFPDSAHLVAVDEPEAYLAAVRGFLTHAPA
jgi:proline iminopeptidase